jgi:myo-inositol catabolism protein IolS
LFQEPAWGAIWEAVDQLKTLAREIEHPLHHLAMRWEMAQPGVGSVLAAALEDKIPLSLLEQMSAISDQAMQKIPDVGNMYGIAP